VEPKKKHKIKKKKKKTFLRGKTGSFGGGGGGDRTIWGPRKKRTLGETKKRDLLFSPFFPLFPFFSD